MVEPRAAAVLSGPGNCLQVWNDAQAMPHLLRALEHYRYNQRLFRPNAELSS